MGPDLTELLSGESIDWLFRPAAGEWSLTEIACHLRDVEREVHQVRFRQIVRQPGCFLVGVAADEWAAQRDYPAQDGRAALQAYLVARQETLAMLDELTEPMWQLHGEHAFFGRTTLHELLYLVVGHDAQHRGQIQDVLHRQSELGQTASEGDLV
jgi:uncharacterized damage-inducible protein DinB